MKTTIGILRCTPQIARVAEEFFGVLKKRTRQMAWITFPSKKMANEFAEAIHIACVDSENNVFK
jgi:hypothetical protein